MEHGEFFLRHHSDAVACRAVADEEPAEVKVELASLSTASPSDDEPTRVRLVIPTNSWEEAYFDRDQALLLAQHITAVAMRLPG